MSLKRSILFVSIALFMAGRVFSQTAQDFEVTFTEDGEGVVIKKFTGKLSSTIRIPAAIEGLPVKEIGERAFVGAGTVTNAMRVMTTNIPFAVVLPQGLIKIGDEAFLDSAITSVVIPDSVTEIGKLAFANYMLNTQTGRFEPPNPLLSSITLPRGLSKVGIGAFRGNSALKTVVIPEGCSVLGKEMFAECTALTTITIPKSITSIPSHAFALCTGLKTLAIPEGVTEIDSGNYGYGAFYGCTALTSVTLPSTITAIGNNAFRGCSALTTVTIPESVETIDGGYIGSEHHGYSGDYDYERTLLEWAFRECGKLSLAAQARLKKITAFSYQREQEKEQEKLQDL